MKKTVAAVVVTYNREKLLVECLNAILAQHRIPEAVFIVDNKSEPATPLALLEQDYIEHLPDFDGNSNQLQQKEIHLENKTTQVFYLRKKENDGGAGGFYEGIKQAYEKGYDNIWIMDDDVIAEPEALEELLRSQQVGEFGFLCSRVVSPNGTSMNMPEIDLSEGENYYPEWDKYLADGIVRVKSATFVSVLLPKETIKKFGYPLREMFIWGDDTEYTLRISGSKPSYYIGTSLVCHKRVISKPPSIKTEKDLKRLKMHFYRFRNQVYYTKKHLPGSQLLSLFGEFIYKMMFLTFRLRIRSCFTMLNGLISGLFFNPEIRFPDQEISDV